MDVQESKELAEKLSGKEVVEEAIEGIYLGIEELLREISMFLEEKEEYLVYLNPTYDDMIVIHVTLEDKIKVSYLTDEDGELKEIFNDTERMA